GDVALGSASSVVASTGSNSNAAGDDITWDNSVDNSVNYLTGGDAFIGNTTNIETTIASHNSAVDESMTDNSLHSNITDSFTSEWTSNTAIDDSVDESINTTISDAFNNSFNEEFSPTLDNDQSWTDSSTDIW